VFKLELLVENVENVAKEGGDAEDVDMIGGLYEEL